ncbi:MAG: flagellar basal body-associated protein FliL [Kiritimatiellia bacterium]|jgi:flagellar basal body-associated protein FliL
MNEDETELDQFGGSPEQQFFTEELDDPDEVEGVAYRPKPPLFALIGAMSGALIIGAGAGVGAALLLNLLTTPHVELDEETELVAISQTLDQISVNLRENGGLQRLTVEVELQAEHADPEYLAPFIPGLRDTVICLASDYTADELLVVQGRRRFRHELEERIAIQIQSDLVQQVHLTQFVVH